MSTFHLGEGGRGGREGGGRLIERVKVWLCFVGVPVLAMLAMRRAVLALLLREDVSVSHFSAVESSVGSSESCFRQESGGEGGEGEEREEMEVSREGEGVKYIEKREGGEKGRKEGRKEGGRENVGRRAEEWDISLQLTLGTEKHQNVSGLQLVRNFLQLKQLTHHPFLNHGQLQPVWGRRGGERGRSKRQTQSSINNGTRSLSFLP